ncbi:glycine zipper family protein [Ferrimonas marina]|uniref:Glycine-zipper containing OmpA-like membrane domain-containing protein n=1 Tax=Ferrimonas marina TaxID=299255 RepID=A0A1M5XVJ8_9GAMM|nr:glycine zipper family protein [Ferrimonas marina]SHI03857.1 Glycine-zipper containing OmpA-like membrane domain-containing protein [Ferrimonas marina]
MRPNLLLVTLFASPLLANPIIYPAEGQSPEQQKQDQAECQLWATDNTGVDPVALANQSAPAQQESGGERLGGAVGGAATGAVIGAIAGDAGKGAAIGAGTGVIAGGARQRRKQAGNEAAVQAQEQDRQAQMDSFNRAFRACMEGRGYSLQ